MRIVVVGAGFAGACAAWLLRERLDAHVTVLEQDAVPGGMLRTLETPEGVPYEYGPRIVSVFRGTPDVIPFLQRFLDLQERQVYQGTRLRPEFPVIPIAVRSAPGIGCARKPRSSIARTTRSRSASVLPFFITMSMRVGVSGSERASVGRREG